MTIAIETRKGRRYAYIRVSTDKQSLSPQVQRETIEAAASRMGVTIDAWFQDAPVMNPDGTINDSVSGKVFLGKRKAGGELMARLKAGDVVFIAKTDRAFRSASDCCQCLDRWERAGVNVIICDMAGLDLSTPMGKAMLQMMSIFAELERRMISQRTKEGLALRTRRGTATSRYPGYGFNWEKRWDAKIQKHVKHKVADPDERRVMREIVRWRLDGHSWDEIREHIVYTLKLITKDGKPWNRPRIMRAFQAELKLQFQENRATGR